MNKFDTLAPHDISDVQSQKYIIYGVIVRWYSATIDSLYVHMEPFRF